VLCRVLSCRLWRVSVGLPHVRSVTCRRVTAVVQALTSTISSSVCGTVARWAQGGGERSEFLTAIDCWCRIVDIIPVVENQGHAPFSLPKFEPKREFVQVLGPKGVDVWEATIGCAGDPQVGMTWNTLATPLQPSTSSLCREQASFRPKQDPVCLCCFQNKSCPPIRFISTRLVAAGSGHLGGLVQRLAGAAPFREAFTTVAPQLPPLLARSSLSLSHSHPGGTHLMPCPFQGTTGDMCKGRAGGPTRPV
jgi:hypothetical protein